MIGVRGWSVTSVDAAKPLQSTRAVSAVGNND
jgi:hypothetical protein